MTIDQPSARESTDSLSDEDDDLRVVPDESDESELEEMLAAFYAD